MARQALPTMSIAELEALLTRYGLRIDNSWAEEPLMTSAQPDPASISA